MSTPNVNSAPTSAAPTQNQDRLKTFFEGQSADTHPSRWDDLWKAGDFLPWDRGFVNPALIDALNERKELFGSPKKEDGSRKKVLVPGCGKGYDLVLFAAYGYDALGLEISENAVKAAEEFLKNPGEGKEGEYKTHDPEIGRGTATVIQADFFKYDWREEEAGPCGKGYDLIYDNTFLSALPPSLRPDWALRMSRLVVATGILVCLEFPTHKPPKSGGPPWALPPDVYEELFKRPGSVINYDEDGRVIKNEGATSENSLARIAHWKPKRTHQVGIINGEVKDWVSVWNHK
ncbi:S-adenosyl-L-methionine-dependent methyltransferase [Aaosphaeria arxii CBS 175.79]|uniref:S-adenosyl-L-methionine-dependent methyltransferase n=1 Tax=Aaosphaeria arxii CBS 175.79 TaxID=1450172 RepID=A0A6A5Y5Q9_9PLEO|nr:S-adenosyl-L-methionine-dependent methyltransferase [Aaosphaeria arxii CBS 175.79]KAF2020181.1 S-adenosyl-L-methionine-dependent methyltransferase [Aaosphaeria arxii CBS 175.79]